MIPVPSHGKDRFDPNEEPSADVYKGKRGNTYRVRWAVAGRRWKESFKQSALAESFRSDLVSAARKGEAFDIASGRPVSMRRTTRDKPWYQFACEFVDVKWPHVAATTRRTHAESLMTVTTAMFSTLRGKPDDKVIRSALCRWGFNTNRRNDPNMPADVAAALRWVEKHTRPVTALERPDGPTRGTQQPDRPARRPEGRAERAQSEAEDLQYGR